jgi:TRAP-type C4-dicarboxylate transport system substrate-binding protein
MNKLKIVIALSTLLLAGSLGAVELKIATLAPERTPWVQDMRKGAKEIKERTDGRVIVKLYVGGSQGNGEQVLRAIRTKRLHGGMFTPTDLQDRYSDLNIYGLPFLFESQSEVDYVREQLDEKLLRGLKEAGFISFGFTNGGFALLMSNEPVRGLDLRGNGCPETISGYLADDRRDDRLADWSYRHRCISSEWHTGVAMAYQGQICDRDADFVLDGPDGD